MVFNNNTSGQKIKRVKNKFKYSLTSATTNVLKIDLKQGYYQNT